ncbi:acyl-CoA thioesterase [Rhodococcus sp. MS16]|uniref:acyl-CoA thioesterase n=1 Tax=Rhodococcus sp. MS16 TaxID=2579941 RepID=UPI001562C105|nr:acyl-CoA thioesterase [Rhodococcus sp. MS16]NRI70049.1 acyl-CoA thioesterase [Rhodococcus sp. MS16]
MLEISGVHANEVDLNRPAALTLTEITQITPALDSTVTDDLVDPNGHMSLPHYVTAAVRAVWARKRSLGLDEALEQGMTFFVTEQHARYLGELVRDDHFTVYPRFLARSTRALHTITYIVDVTRQRLACSIESVSVSVSKETRHSVDMTQTLADNLDAAIRHDAALPGRPSLCAGLWR